MAPKNAKKAEKRAPKRKKDRDGSGEAAGQYALPMSTDDPTAVDARPTKRFFISVITRDISLTRAILDLIDNAVDAAARHNGAPKIGRLDANEKKRYKGLHIKVNCSPTEFSVVDNCYGMELDVARHYAFRFGHDDSPAEKAHAPVGKSRIGLFGIGLKRGLFKIGNAFSISSATERSEFEISESVSAWLTRPSWDFHFSHLAESRASKSETKIGTTIRITSLHDAVRDEFKNGSFITNLGREVGDALQEYIRRGLEVEVTSDDNSAPVPQPDPVLYVGEGVVPAALEKRVRPAEGAPVDIRIYAGIGPADYKRAGWNVFCNGRLVVNQDKTSLTGWGAKDPVRIPRYHKQFDRFFGYVYFESDDPKALPWNTTKTGVDEESALYVSVRDMMIEQMKPIIDLFNQLRAEQKLATEGKGRVSLPVTAVIRRLDQEGEATALTQLDKATAFSWPKPAVQTQVPKKNATVLVAFARPEAELRKARSYFKVGDDNDAAERAFVYWLEDARRKDS